MRLTKGIIERATYEGESYEGKDGYTKWRRHVLWDDEIKGLGVRIQPTGRKFFVLSYRVGSRKRQMTLGEFGVLTLHQARERARKELVSVIDGGDPLKAREEGRKGGTLSQLAERYLEEYAIPKKKPLSVKEDRRLLEKHVLPRLGSRQTIDIDRDDMSRLHHAMRETPTQANRVIALVSRIMTLAEKWGIRPDYSNPCRHIDRFPEVSRERYLTGAELQRLGQVLAEAERSQSEPLEAISAIRLLLLTGCRRNEILHLEWGHVDVERSCLHLPDSKTGRKLVPLGAPALALLEDLPRLASSPYVFPGRFGRGSFVGLGHVWERIRENAGIPDVRLHDLRHSFASVGAGGGLSLVILGKLLGHRNSATTARYSHLADDPLKRAADRIAGSIARQLNVHPSEA